MEDTASAPQEELQITVRQANDSDWNYIYDTWKRSYFYPWFDRYQLFLPASWSRDSSDTYRVYNRGISRQIDTLRVSPDVVFVIAADPADTRFIYGWSCMGDGGVYYVYVRDTLRRARIASRLVGDRFKVVCKYWTPDCIEIQRATGKLEYNP